MARIAVEGESPKSIDNYTKDGRFDIYTDFYHDPLRRQLLRLARYEVHIHNSDEFASFQTLHLI